MSSDSWKHIRVYVASGYYDMEGERQHLNDVVLPQLRQQCILYRTQVKKFRLEKTIFAMTFRLQSELTVGSIVQVHFVDLRVGLNENDFYQLIELKGCVAFLEEIDRCRPFFIGFYGHKYGTPLSNYRLPREPRWSKVPLPVPGSARSSAITFGREVTPEPSEPGARSPNPCTAAAAAAAQVEAVFPKGRSVLELETFWALLQDPLRQPARPRPRPLPSPRKHSLPRVRRASPRAG